MFPADLWDSSDDELGKNEATQRFQPHKNAFIQSNGGAPTEDDDAEEDAASQDRYKLIIAVLVIKMLALCGES